MAPPVLDEFLRGLPPILGTKDGAKLQQYLLIEPPLPERYNDLVNELRQFYPAGTNERLDQKCSGMLPEDQGEGTGGSWTAFISFLVQYFNFVRDVDPSQLVETLDMLKSLLNQCILALSDASMGIVVLPTVLAYSHTIARLAIGLEKHPELMQSLTTTSASAGDDALERVTLVESTANVIREAFKKCLSERSGNVSTGLDAAGRPEGRRIGIYACANLCLRLFFHCRQLRSAEQIFGNIYAQSPPLACYPAAQRVAYLHYLGRYHLANNHFPRAALALGAAYAQCPARFVGQRASILPYLVAANLVLGRFPSATLLARPEAQQLAPHFEPLCAAIRIGDVPTFRTLLDESLAHPTARWLRSRRLLLQLRDRAEVLVFRSLARRTFLLAGYRGERDSKRAPNLDLGDLVAAMGFLEEKAKDVVAEGSGAVNGVGDRGAVEERVHPDLEGEVDPSSALPSLEEVEAYVASLVQQGLLRGYVSHRHAKFVIQGVRNNAGRSAAEVGFPSVWSVLGKEETETEVPGWVRKRDAEARKGGGRVVNLSGVRPIGVTA